MWQAPALCFVRWLTSDTGVLVVGWVCCVAGGTGTVYCAVTDAVSTGCEMSHVDAVLAREAAWALAEATSARADTEVVMALAMWAMASDAASVA